MPALFRLTHTRLQVAVRFVAGLMLGLAVLALLRHGTHAFPLGNQPCLPGSSLFSRKGGTKLFDVTIRGLATQ